MNAPVPTRARRLAALLPLAVVAVLVGAPTPGSAQAPFPTTVSAVAYFAPITELYRDCDGVAHEVVQPEFGVLVERAGSLSEELTVPVTYSGDLADNLLDAPTEVIIPAGSDYGEVLGSIDPVEPGTLLVTLEPGVGYDVGEATMEIVVEPPYDAVDCNDEIDVYADRRHQTIDEGERPKPFGFFDWDEDGIDENIVGAAEIDGQIVTWDESDYVGEYATPVVGAVPPGLTYERDRWGGAATSPGTYAFQVRVCIVDALPLDSVGGVDAPSRARAARLALRAAEDLPNVCVGTADVSVEVLAAQAAPGPSAAPASPISADARFTG